MDLPARKSFSESNPMLQIAWDSTSIGALKSCPRYYYLNIVLGYVPRDESVHLTFGLRYHEALEIYDHVRFSGGSHQTALRAAVRRALTDTWDKEKHRPWFSDHKTKNRETLIRTIVWYLDRFQDDPMRTVALANDKPAVELSFRLGLGRKAKSGEEMLLCGHMDRIVDFSEKIWVSDRKTTSYTISPDFFERYSPDNQFSCYIYAGRIVYNTPLAGLIVDVAQVAVNFSRYARGPVLRSQSQLDEWRGDLEYWLGSAEYFAASGYWPQNDKFCSMYGGCQYRKVCGMSAGNRNDWLERGFTKRWWDPLSTRGDI